MSSYLPISQHAFQDHSAWMASNVPLYGHYNAPRSKTPTSLINYRGSSGPLSTPSTSRHTSQDPEVGPEQVKPMVADDGFTSSSSSSIAATTPDHDGLEPNYLESPPMYYFCQSQDGSMPNGNNSEGNYHIPETHIQFTPQGHISDQTLQTHLNPFLAAPTQLFQDQFTFQNSQPRNASSHMTFSDSTYDQMYSPQSMRQDPWNGQGPPRNPQEPHSGVVVFDPATDPLAPPVDFDTLFQMQNIDTLVLNEPNDFIPPDAPILPLAAQHSHQYRDSESNQQQSFRRFSAQTLPHALSHDSSPVDLTLMTALPRAHSQGSRNYDASPSNSVGSLSTDLSVGPSLINSVEYPPTSPLASALSPGGSEGLLSWYDMPGPGSLTNLFPGERVEVAPLPRPPPMVAKRSQTGTSSDGPFDDSPEPESRPIHRPGPVRVRPGGRALGTHLKPTVAKAAHDMRRITACWHCVLQRDKCGPGDICKRCVNRAQRPNADCGLGCTRIKLGDLARFFLPMLVMQQHEEVSLTHFVTQFIHRWSNKEITIMMTCSEKKMPRIAVKAYEFFPRGEDLLQQVQYKTNPITGQRYEVLKRSPPLGMVHINRNEEKKYDKYVNDIVDYHIEDFADICWGDDDNDFAPRLFRLMMRVQPKEEDDIKLHREVARLVVCTYIMSHTLTIAEETKLQALSKMHSYEGSFAFADKYTSPRMAGRQLKYYFARLQRSIVTTVLNRVQQMLKSSRGCDKWISAFIAVAGMAMAYEDQQKTIHQVMQTRAITECLDRREAQDQAEIACREIDEQMNFICELFRWKYNRKCNPLQDSDEDWKHEVGFEDEKNVEFVRNVAQLVKENIGFLQSRQCVSISVSNQSKYTARIVGKFLLSFWFPSSHRRDITHTSSSPSVVDSGLVS